MKIHLIVLLILVLSCFDKDSKGSVVAKINGSPVMSSEVDLKIREDLQELESRIYQLRRQAIEDIATDKIVAQVAENQKMTVAEFWAKFESDRGTDPTDSEIQVFLASKNLEPEKSKNISKTALVEIVKAARIREQKMAFVADLRAKAKVEVLLKKPAVKRLEIGTGGSAPLGSEGAPIVVVVFSDFQSPFCLQAANQVREIVEKYGSKVAVYFRHFPLESMHPQAMRASEASLCAQEQSKFWTYHDAIFENQTKLNEKSSGLDEFLLKLGENVNVDSARFSECLKSGKYKSMIQKDLEDGRRLGVSGTPSYFVNGIGVSKPLDDLEIYQVIDDELSRLSGT